MDLAKTSLSKVQGPGRRCGLRRLDLEGSKGEVEHEREVPALFQSAKCDIDESVDDSASVEALKQAEGERERGKRKAHEGF